jgi:hypothetical protein
MCRYIVITDLVPDRKEHLRPAARFTGGKAVELPLRPTLLEEARAEDHDAEGTRAKAFVYLLAQAVAKLDLDLIEPDAELAASEVVRERAYNGVFVLRCVTDEDIEWQVRPILPERLALRVHMQGSLAKGADRPSRGACSARSSRSRAAVSVLQRARMVVADSTTECGVGGLT